MLMPCTEVEAQFSRLDPHPDRALGACLAVTLWLCLASKDSFKASNLNFHAIKRKMTDYCLKPVFTLS